MGKRKQNERRFVAINNADLVSMRPFRHPPLPSPQSHIRLLDLLPPSSGGVLRCRLRPVSIVDDPLPEYTALSYEWGSEGVMQTILVNNAPLSIRLNLWRLLETLGRTSLAVESRLRNIWVDAISINQQDNRERNHQVQLMKLIYTKAVHTVVWLPDPGNLHQFGYWVHATPLMNTSRDIGDQKDQDQILGSNLLERPQKANPPHFPLSRGMIFGGDVEKQRASLPLVQDFVETADENISVDANPISTPLDHMRDHSYWSRLWIIQEFVLSREVTILFEDGPVPWSICEAALNWNKTLANKPDGALQMLSDMRSQFSSRLFSIEQLLTVFQHSKCVDPRDKVFGLTGLVEKGETFPVDYSDDIRIVFFKTLAHFQGTRHQSRTIGDILGALKTALGLPGGLALSHDSMSVTRYLTTRIQIPVFTWSGSGILNTFSRVRKCRCGLCYYLRRPLRGEFSLLMTWRSTSSRFCVSSSLDSTLVLLFTKSKSSKWEFYAAAHQSLEESHGTLVFHNTELASLSKATYNGDTQGTIEVEPEVVDAIVFRYSGSLARLGRHPHKFNNYLSIWPLEKHGTATERRIG